MTTNRSTHLLTLTALLLSAPSCAHSSTRPNTHGPGISVTSELLGWESPPVPQLSMGRIPTPGEYSIGPPISTLVTVHNGDALDAKVTLSCGELYQGAPSGGEIERAPTRPVTVSVKAGEEMDLVFYVTRRWFINQSFDCRVVSVSHEAKP